MSSKGPALDLARPVLHRWPQLRRSQSLLSGGLLVWACVTACDGSRQRRAGAREHSGPPVAPSGERSNAGPDGQAPVVGSVGSQAVALEACLAQIQAVRGQAPLAGTPQLDARRAELLARAKAEPVLFVRAPQADEVSGPLRHRALELRQQLELPGGQAVRLFSMYSELRRNAALARAVLLRAGYLYSESPALGFALSYVVKLEDLFDAARLRLERGGQMYELLRTERAGQAYYAFAQSPNERANLWLFDRVSPWSTELGVPLHRDVSELQRQLHFDQLRVVHAAEAAWVVDLTYEGYRVQTVVNAATVRLTLACEAVPSALRTRLTALRDKREAQFLSIQALRGVIDAFVAEGAAFDEPRTEEGQQDGHLRQAWEEAYVHGANSYVLNDDRYPVFNRLGQATPPQVCIDFVADCLERLSGNWWLPDNVGQSTGAARRGRSRGRLDFTVELGRHDRRRVAPFIAAALAQPDRWNVRQFAANERVPLRRRRAFYEHLAKRRADFQSGDVVVIYGQREEDNQAHFHSFFVYRNDPVTAMPIWLASNAVVPQIRTWEAEMLNAPRRSVFARLRPSSAWLARLVAPPAGLTAELPRVPDAAMRPE